jgi:integration host factor subunit beta
MTKSELIALLAERYSVGAGKLTFKDVDDAVNTIVNTMCATLAQGNRIEIRGFGSFALNYRPPRVGRNPKTGGSVHVPAKYVPHFKPGKEMRERVDSMAGTPILDNEEI